MQGEGVVIRSIIDKLQPWDMQGDPIEGESGVTWSIIDELQSSDIRRDQKEGEGGVIRSITDELHSSDLVKWKVKVVLIEVSLTKFNLDISK